MNLPWIKTELIVACMENSGNSILIFPEFTTDANHAFLKELDADGDSSWCVDYLESIDTISNSETASSLIYIPNGGVQMRLRFKIGGTYFHV